MGFLRVFFGLLRPPWVSCFAAGDATAEGTAAAVHAHPGVGGFHGGYKV